MVSHKHARRPMLLLAGTLCLATVAGAQESGRDNAAGITLETVTVTGTRIQRPDFTSDSPIVSVGAEAMSQTGSTSIEHLLNQLPQFVPSVTTTSNNPGNSGQANLDLRGLGTLRNLVLLNGRRLPPSNPTGVVDVNIVPAALVDRVEVVSGGASAVYGSDAIAGVTNFVLKKNFEGVALQAGYGRTAEQDGVDWSSSLTLGSNFADDRGNAVLNFQYTERDAVYQGARAFSTVALDVRQQGNSSLGSGTILEGRYDRASTNSHTQAAMDQVFARYGAAPGTVPRAQNIGFNADGTLFSIGTGQANSVVNFRGDSNDPGFNANSFSYNFAPTNALSLPVQRWNLAGFLNLKMNDSTEAYAQAFFTTYDTTAQLAPVPATGLTIPTTNPFVPADLRTLLDSRPNAAAPFTFRQRMQGVGPRQTTDEYDVYQLLGGVRGTLGERFSWDAFAATSSMSENTILNNDVSLTRLEQLLDSPTGGTEVCAGGYNPFVGPAGLSADCADFVRSYFTNRTRLESSLAEATLGGTAFATGAGDARFSVGAGWREESFRFDPDLAVARGDLLGFNQQNPLRGAFNIKELFAELYVPFLQDARYAQNLSMTLGARFSDHSISGTAQSYKVEGTWQPLAALRFRTSYQKAVRAPSISELFSPANQNFPSLLEDPCSNLSSARTLGPAADASRGGNGAIRALCVAQGIPAADIDTFSYPFTQVESFGGGNPDLNEESADTVTLGAVFDSPWSGRLSGLRASVDYYSIRLKDAIFSIPAGEIVLLCYGFSGNNPNFDPNDPACQAIDRRTDSSGNVSDGSPFVPSQGTANVSELNTAGVDLQIDWGLDLGGAGKLDLNLLANWLQQWEISYLPNLPAIDYKGTVGDNIGTAFPDYKLFFGANWSRGPLGAGIRARYLPAMANKYASYDPGTTVGADAVTYLDLNASWRLRDTLEFRVGVENATDEQPPLYTSSVQMNTDPSTYDVLGRRYYVRANMSF